MDIGLLDFDVTRWALGALYVAGVLTAADAIMKARTPQGATAWVFALIAFPFVALPLYWVLGRFKFDDYLEALRGINARIDERVREATDGPLRPFLQRPGDDASLRDVGERRAFDRMATLPFTRGNGVELLVDGEATFAALFDALDAAESYVLTQFYILRDDELGRAYQQRLVAAARRGVTVRLLYDSVGSWRLPRRYRRELEAAGVRVCAFAGPRNWLKKLRLNFRNHRKITVVDGRVGFVGGLNVGDEYLGRDPGYGPWRDTHLRLQGPVVQGLQLSFYQDWYYAAREELDDLRWAPERAEADVTALVLASGPADELETCGLLYTHVIESAEERLWIATPYFVPDGRILGALQLAALRGVDVRVLMPRTSDSVFFRYVPYAYLREIERAGVHVYLYEPGIMHQKVTLVDHDFATVGTANFDSRSFRLNFESTVVVTGERFCGEVAAMLEADFARATRLTGSDLDEHSFAFRFAANATRLLAPVL